VQELDVAAHVFLVIEESCLTSAGGDRARAVEQTKRPAADPVCLQEVVWSLSVLKVSTA